MVVSKRAPIAAGTLDAARAPPRDTSPGARVTMRRRAWGRWAWGAAIGYVALLHLAVVAMLAWPDSVLWRLRSWRQDAGIETLSEFRAVTADMQRALDATVRPGAVWFFGDSIVQRLDVGRVTARGINLGIGDDTTQGLRARIAGHSALGTASAILLAIGTNDFLYRAPPAAAAIYRDILRAIPAGPAIVVSAVLPVDERASPDLAGRNRLARALNDELAALCRAEPRCRFADATAALVDASGNLDRRHHVGDGLHLSSGGYARLIATWRIALGNPGEDD